MTDERENMVAGRIQSVIYQNEETGYAVLRLLTEEDELVTVVGCVPFPAPGESLSAEGRWTTHPVHGEQFVLESQYRQLPTEETAIFEYLASGVIRGIGAATARQIVELFGDAALEVIAQHPSRLTQIKGISASRAKQIGATFRTQNGIQRLMELLLENDLSPAIAVRLFQRYGDSAGETLQKNPYLLLDEYFGVDFDDADRLAQNQGIDESSPLRLEAACLYTLQFNAEQGHVFIPRQELLRAAAGMLECDENMIADALDRLIARGQAVQEQIENYEACYSALLFEAESETGKRLAALKREKVSLDTDADKLLDKLEQEQGITYAPRQREAVLQAARCRVLVLTGGPGTGKTTTVRALISLFQSLRMSVALAAPTGRAAKRLSEVTGKDAKTIHRLLEMCPDPETHTFSFQRTERNPLDADVVVVDEVSMVDILLMRALLCALKPGTHLILVGDADQLPAVGPGQILEDVQALLGCVKLTEIFRQAQSSKIVTGAHSINRGELPELRNNGQSDLFFMRRSDPDAALKTMIELCTERLPKNMDIHPHQIQVLSPTRKGSSGTIALNAALQQALNPHAPGKNETQFGSVIFREGDRVMQIRNNYDLVWTQEGGDAVGVGVFNGDVGVLTVVDNMSKTVTVRYDDRLAVYAYDQLTELEPAYAVTVHKSQGSEYDAVLLAALKGPRPLMTRRVLYTAITRAKNLLVIVGDEQVLADMTKNAQRRDRYSGLRCRLQGLLEA